MLLVNVNPQTVFLLDAVYLLVDKSICNAVHLFMAHPVDLADF